ERGVEDHEGEGAEKYGLESIGRQTGGDLSARGEREVAFRGCAASEDTDSDAFRARRRIGHDADSAAGDTASGVLASESRGAPPNAQVTQADGRGYISSEREPRAGAGPAARARRITIRQQAPLRESARRRTSRALLADRAPSALSRPSRSRRRRSR